jgi:hypothetical protein
LPLLKTGNLDEFQLQPANHDSSTNQDLWRHECQRRQNVR